MRGAVDSPAAVVVPLPSRRRVPAGVERRRPRRSRPALDYDTEWARRTPARLARRSVSSRPCMRPSIAALAAPERRGLDRLADLLGTDRRRRAGPVIFAANHHSHLDTPLVLTVAPGAVARTGCSWPPPPTTSSATGSRGAVSALVLNAIPIERTQGQPPLGRRRRRADRRRLEPADLPRGRALPRRLGPAVPGRRRLPVAALRRARRARSTSTAPAGSCGKGMKRADAVADGHHVRSTDVARGRRGLAAVRRPHRGRGGRPGRRDRSPTGTRPGGGRRWARRRR